MENKNAKYLKLRNELSNLRLKLSLGSRVLSKEEINEIAARIDEIILELKKETHKKLKGRSK